MKSNSSHNLNSKASLAKNIVKSNFGRLEFPYKLTFVLTYWCNYRCKTCDIWKRKPTNELTTSEIVKFFKTSNHFNWIDFTGGEIWIRNDFIEIAKSAIQNCKNLALIHFPTNGFLTEKIVNGTKAILKHHPPKFIITVSLDGDEQKNDDIRGIKGGWKRQIETFKQLKELNGVETYLGMTLSKHNLGLYQSTFASVKKVYPELRPQDFHLNIAHESAHYYGNDGQNVNGNDTDSMINEVEAYRKSRNPYAGPVSYIENKYLKQVKKYLQTGKTPVPCHALKSSCFIDSWGNVYPCGMYDKKIGSLRDYDFNLKQIWNLPTTEKLQKEIWEGNCPQCWTPCEAYQSVLGNLLP